MPKHRRPNPLKARGPKSPRPRRRIKRRPLQIPVHRVHCNACKERYELTGNGPIKFCIFCKSADLTVSQGFRRETPAEKKAREMEFNLRFMNGIGQILNGLFGAFVPGFNQAQQNGHGNPTSALESELLKEGYRKLAMKYHPDKGGDPEKMKELNKLKERLGL